MPRDVRSGAFRATGKLSPFEAPPIRWVQLRPSLRQVRTAFGHGAGWEGERQAQRLGQERTADVFLPFPAAPR